MDLHRVCSTLFYVDLLELFSHKQQLGVGVGETSGNFLRENLNRFVGITPLCFVNKPQAMA